MEIILFLLLVVVIVLILDIKSSFRKRLDLLNERLERLSVVVQKLQKGDGIATRDIKPVEPRIVESALPKPVAEPLPRKQETPGVKDPAKEPGLHGLPKISQPEEIKNEKSEPKVPEPAQPERITIPGSITPPTQPKPVYIPQVPAKPGFFERNPDMEKFIGENLANKIGIGILVLGIGFFVKYAIDQEWIGVYGRVLIGILCGGILLGLAHRMRKTFAAFSSVLVGGGIAVLYLTITIAFQEYQILPQTPAFLILVLITAFTIMLSLAYDRIELAILAILGGFGSPFMVSSGEGNYIVLFSYILILDIGMLILAYYKKWSAINVISYAFTILLFGSWLVASYDHEKAGMMTGGLIFATLFYFTFFGMNIVHNIRVSSKFIPIDIFLLLSNTFLYYAAGMILLNNNSGEPFMGLFTAMIGVFNFIFAYTLFKNNKIDRTILYLLIGLVLTFISLAAPVQLEGNYITLFWAAETVLLLWLSQKSKIFLMKVASIIVMVLMFFSLLMDLEAVYYRSNDLAILLNKGYITSIISFVSIVLTILVLRKEADLDSEILKIYKTILILMAGAVFYVANLLELRHQLAYFFDHVPSVTVIIGVYNMLFVSVLLLVKNKFPSGDLFRYGITALGIFAIVGYFVVYHNAIIDSRNALIDKEASSMGFGFHYLLILLLVVIASRCLIEIRSWTNFNKETGMVYSWFFVGLFVFIASAELDHTIVITLASADTLYKVLEQNHKIGFPILWGIASFILIAIGLKRKQKNLRIISLTLLLLTLLKLFLWDIRGISEGGKIAAFISLGILLLVVSFMYQRLKKFLMIDEENTKQDNAGL